MCSLVSDADSKILHEVPFCKSDSRTPSQGKASPTGIMSPSELDLYDCLEACRERREGLELPHEQTGATESEASPG
jgi:hypothetical protein